MGGFLQALAKHFSVGALAQIVPAAGLSFLWTKTSFITPPFTAMLPLVAIALLIGSAYLTAFRSLRSHPLVQITPLALGFCALAMPLSGPCFMAAFGALRSVHSVGRISWILLAFNCPGTCPHYRGCAYGNCQALVGAHGFLSLVGLQCSVPVWSDIHAIPLFHWLQQRRQFRSIFCCLCERVLERLATL